MQLREFVRLIRGETSEDPRPNKGLEVPSHAEGWISYKYRHLLEDIVMHGVRPRWNSQFRQQCTPPRYHASATSCLNVLVEQIRKGLDSDKYLVLDIDLLAELEGIICSPFGAVEKSSPDTSHQARAIHGLSYPELASVNDNTAADDSVIVTFDGPQALARRILEVEVEFPDDAMMMSGDVSGAFKHIPVHADHVGRFFLGAVPELGILVIDLSCLFGWRLSPQHYWTAGAVITHLMRHRHQRGLSSLRKRQHLSIRRRGAMTITLLNQTLELGLEKPISLYVGQSSAYWVQKRFMRRSLRHGSS
ncbi:hypothetical protein L917_12893 [Phytophthora nicotianae]|uniref:Reverse transcriptase domain-containing protein n=1 Tax=Phytophthora nicotianae TaxID=4792 RepID=W2KSD1_PHYNI|nr:hypothetical protein L917_12893 [Phytophthora nicotianae]